jgi:hypothetical protein
MKFGVVRHHERPLPAARHDKDRAAADVVAVKGALRAAICDDLAVGDERAAPEVVGNDVGGHAEAIGALSVGWRIVAAASAGLRKFRATRAEEHVASVAHRDGSHDAVDEAEPETKRFAFRKGRDRAPGPERHGECQRAFRGRIDARVGVRRARRRRVGRGGVHNRCVDGRGVDRPGIDGGGIDRSCVHGLGRAGAPATAEEAQEGEGRRVSRANRHRRSFSSRHGRSGPPARRQSAVSGAKGPPLRSPRRGPRVDGGAHARMLSRTPTKGGDRFRRRRPTRCCVPWRAGPRKNPRKIRLRTITRSRSLPKQH